MKRAVTIVIAAVMIIALAVPVAYAAPPSPGRHDITIGVEPLTMPDGNPGYEIVQVYDEKDKNDEDYFEHRVWVPAPDMYMYTYGNRKKLDATDIQNFEDSYASIKKNTVDMVLYFFWLTLSDSYLEYLEDYDDYYFRLDFIVSSEIEDGDVKISLNGEDISDDLVIVNGDGTMTVLFEYLPAPIVIRIKK